MLIGPLPLYCVHRLEELLKLHSSDYEVFVSTNRLEKHWKHKDSGWSFENWNYLYIEIAIKDVMIVRKELNDMGVSLHEGVPEPSDPRVIAFSGTKDVASDTLVKMVDHIEAVKHESKSELRAFLILAVALLTTLVAGIYILVRTTH